MPKKKTDKKMTPLDIILKALEDKKAEDISIFNVKGLVDYTDHFVFCSATSAPHIDAISREVYTALRREKHHVKESGDKKSGWVVLDCGEIIVHCFGKAERAFYDLEQLWQDADVVHHHY